MRKAFKLIGFLAFIAVLFVGVASVAFYYLVREGEFRRFLISEIEQKTALRLRLGEADLEVGRILGVSFRDVALSESDSSQAAITAERITARVALLPLLERKLIFYEIHLRKPTVRLLREKDGKVPLLDRLVNLPFLKNNDPQFTLDLRTIKLADGEVYFYDQFTGEAPSTMRLRDLDLELERLSGVALREFLQKLVRPKAEQPRGSALAFNFRTDVERDGNHATARARGTMVFPDDQLEIQKIWLNAETWVTDIPGSMIQSYAGHRLPVRSVSGTLNSRLHLEGSLKERVHIKGELVFNNFTADAPEIFSLPLTPGDGRVELDVNWYPQRWNVSRLELRSKELKLELKGVVSRTDDSDPHVQLNLVTPALPVAVVKKYLPLKWIHSPRIESLIGSLQQGDLRLSKAGLNAKLSEISQMAKTGFDERLWLDAELHDIGASFAGHDLPLRRIQGRISLERGLLVFKSLTGDYGQSRLTKFSGSYGLSGGDFGSVQLQVQGEVDLSELREQLKQGFFPAQIASIASSIEEMAGKGKLNFAVSGRPESTAQVSGTITLDGARLQLASLSLSEIRGDMAISPSEIKAEKVHALLSGSPVQIRLALQDYVDGHGTFDLLVDSTGVKAGVITRLLLSSGSLQDPGVVRGSIRYRGSFGTKEGREFTGILDLANVQLATAPLLQPLKELNGRIKIDEAGIDFQNIKGLLVGFPANFSGRWRYSEKPQLVFDFAAPNLDLSLLSSQIDPETTDFYARLQAEGKIVMGRGRVNELEFSDFKSDVVIDRRVWRLNNATLRSAGGLVQGLAMIGDRPDTVSFNVTPKIQSIPVTTFLRWFDMTNTDMTGRVNLTGNLQSMGKDGAERKQNLNGSFSLRIEDGTIHRLRILIQILNLLDLSRWFTFKMPDLAKQGIRFRSITGDFKVANGVYSTENLLIDSDDLRMTGAGKIDVPRDAVDFVVAVRPFAGIDPAIHYIPLIGRSIAAIKNSFLVASFNVTGSVDDPTIAPAPLSTLSEVFFGVLGIPKSVIGFDGYEKTEESGNERSNEAANERIPVPKK